MHGQDIYDLRTPALQMLLARNILLIVQNRLLHTTDSNNIQYDVCNNSRELVSGRVFCSPSPAMEVENEEEEEEEEERKMINDYDDKDNIENASLLVGNDIVWWRHPPPATLDDNAALRSTCAMLQGLLCDCHTHDTPHAILLIRNMITANNNK